MKEPQAGGEIECKSLSRDRHFADASQYGRAGAGSGAWATEVWPEQGWIRLPADPAGAADTVRERRTGTAAQSRRVAEPAVLPQAAAPGQMGSAARTQDRCCMSHGCGNHLIRYPKVACRDQLPTGAFEKLRVSRARADDRNCRLVAPTKPGRTLFRNAPVRAAAAQSLH